MVTVRAAIFRRSSPAAVSARHAVDLLANGLEVGQVLGEGPLRTGRLGLPRGLDRPVVDAVRQAEQPVGAAPDDARQALHVEAADVDQGDDAVRAELAGRDGADAEQRIDRKLLQEGLDPLGRDDGQPVRLPPARGDLRQELVGGDSGRGGQAGLLADLLLQALGDRRGQRLGPRVLGHVEVSFIEGERLDRRRHGPEQREHLPRDGLVLGEIGPHDHKLGATAHPRSPWASRSGPRTPAPRSLRRPRRRAGRGGRPPLPDGRAAPGRSRCSTDA